MKYKKKKKNVKSCCWCGRRRVHAHVKTVRQNVKGTRSDNKVNGRIAF